ncbi:MAG: DUF2452 domain-containing protein [Gammaproteobacteria bacterium]|nr:DUF2452 domain-containing protein [Gammaproteobacteria bacterium]
MNHESKKYNAENHQGSDASSPYPVSRLSPQIELVDLAKQIANADTMVSTRLSSQLKVIADQIRSLQAEAKTILESAQLDQELHHAACNFKRIPGKIYHLYRKQENSCYFSMLSPEDWNGRAPHAYVNSYRLENDMSWTPLDKLNEIDDSVELVNRVLLEKGF